MKRVDLELEQVIFEGTPVGLGEQLTHMKGVTDVKVDGDRHIARVTYDDSQLTLDEVHRLVAECGHAVRSCGTPHDLDGEA